MVDYYDKLLVAIPAVIVLGVVSTIHPAVAIYQGLVIGSLVATVVLFEMLFRNPPVEPTPADMGAVAIWGLGWLLTIVMYL
ncbi:MAG: hypothetical protein V5A39_05105 [Haloarculaceae archaeon]